MTTDNDEKSSGWWKWLKWWLVPLSLLILFCVLSTVHRMVMDHSLEQIKADIRADGHPLSMEELDKWYAKPEGKNAADIYLEAFNNFTEWDNEKANEKGLPVIGGLRLPPRGEPLPEIMRTAIAEYLAVNKKTLELLHEAGTIGGCRFPVDFDGSATPLPHLYGARRCTYLLQLAAIQEADSNNPAKAYQYIMDSFILARKLQGEPIIVSNLVSIAMYAITTSSLEKVMNRIELSPDQLKALQEEIEIGLKNDGSKNALLAERAFNDYIFRMAESGGIHDIFNPAGLVGGRAYILANNSLFFLYSFTGMLKRDEMASLELYSHLIPAADKPYFKLSTIDDKANNSISEYALLTHDYLFRGTKFFRSICRNKAIMITAATALAVERFRIEQGRLPDSLDKLVPKYIKTIPLDPFDGGRLRYKKIDTRNFVVYSVNDDLRDDGGLEYSTLPPRERALRTDVDAGETCDVTFSIGPSPELEEWQKTIGAAAETAEEEGKSEE